MRAEDKKWVMLPPVSADTFMKFHNEFFLVLRIIPFNSGSLKLSLFVLNFFLKKETSKSKLITNPNLSPVSTISAAIISGFLAGWYYVAVMTTHPLKIFRKTIVFSFLLFMCVLNLAFSIFCNSWVFVLVLNFIFFIIGYLIKSRIFLSRKEKEKLPEVIPDNLKSKEGGRLQIKDKPPYTKSN